MAKVLGGIACTIGVLALSMGVAHAEEKDQGRKLGAQVAVNAKSNVAATPKVNLPKAKVTVPRARVRVQSTQRRPAVRTQARANTRPRPIVRAARPTVRTQARPAARVKANIRAQARPAERVRSNVAATARRAVRSAPEVTAGVRKAARARVTTKAQPVRRTTAARRPVVRAGAQAKAAVVKRTSAKSTSSLRAKLASTPRLDEAVKQSPTAMADADAQVAGIPVYACARVNAGGCADTGPGTEPGGSTVVPMIAGDGTATAEGLANGTVCLRINGGDCGNQAGTDGGTEPGSTVVPVIAGDGTATAEDLANGTVCLRINGGDCGAGGTDGGTEPGGSTVVPVIAGDGTATAEDLANGT
ncbi:MAG TPA: hypothetical protein VGW74_03700, partial [Propionibacteriaceae bacterium]|nr:hypothetical protein [Propionibacteriaceae bacterium]